MGQRYLVCILLAIAAVLAGCEAAAPQAEAFNHFNAQAVLDALRAEGLSVENQRRDMLVSPDVPASFSERYVFMIDRIAPAGGQLLIFNSRENMDTWQAYVDRQRSSSATRRNFVYVYANRNALLVLSPDLTTDDATAWRAIFERLS